MKKDIQNNEDYKFLMDTLERGIIKYIQSVLKEYSKKEVTEQEAKNFFSHIVVSFLKKGI